MQTLVEETNRYAAQMEADPKWQEESGPKSRLTRWEPTDEREMKKFIGLLLLMGLTDKPSIHEYWSHDPIDYTPIFGQTMSRNRFQLLLQCFHVADSKAKTKDRLFKVRPMLNHFHDTMTDLYYPRRRICIDESLLLFKGRLAWKQYLKKAKCRFGIKFFVLCESKNSLVYRMMMYCGKLDELAGEGLASRVVLTLLADILNNGHSLYMDNWYNSIQLTEHLLLNRTHLTGTMRGKSSFPKHCHGHVMLISKLS